MRPKTPILQLVISVAILFAQIAGGFTRVVHCYDSNCELSRLNWECHAMCDGTHSQNHDACDHDGSGASFESQLEHTGEGLIVRSAPCGSDHHHHYVSTGEIGLVSFPSVGLDEVSLPVTLHKLYSEHRNSSGLPLSFHMQDVKGRPAVPLVTRLRI